MIFVARDSDNGPMLELDEEGIDYLIVGLEQLRAAEPGHEFSAPTLAESGGEPAGVAAFILRRA